MAAHTVLPHESGRVHVVWTGLETDLIFNRGVEVPGFAAFPLVLRPDTRQLLVDLAVEQINLAADAGLGTILDSCTWMANRDRADGVGYLPDQLDEINREAMALLDEARAAAGRPDVLISACVGPRGDGYDPGDHMTAEEAERYHGEQIRILSSTAADLVSAYTLNYPNEAIGIARAAASARLPVVISFTVETDGRLNNGQTIDEAIAETDDATDGVIAYYMVNCAHPDHFGPTLSGNPRLRGFVVNASRCSHAELDEADELDAGDPVELGELVAGLVRLHPHVCAVGGCCGTDFRHLRSMAAAVGST